MMRVLLLDGDVLAYSVASALEVATDWGDGVHTLHADEGEGIETLDRKIANLRQGLEADAIIIALTCDETVNFRKVLYPEYKANRKTKRKPLILKALREHLITKHAAKTKPTLEADDILGILSTKVGPIAKGFPACVEKIICSIDKDFKSIPGKYYNLTSEELLTIDEEAADYAFMMQTLTGDAADNYKGLPGCGPKKAEKILLAEHDAMGDWWPRVVAAYSKVGLSEEVALTQARLARILRASDYDFTNKRPILWEPRYGKR